MQIRKHGPKQKFIIEDGAEEGSEDHSPGQSSCLHRKGRKDSARRQLNSPFNVGSLGEVFLELLQVGECHFDVWEENG
jgi:hypothetical protein